MDNLLEPTLELQFIHGNSQSGSLDYVLIAEILGILFLPLILKCKLQCRMSVFRTTFP